MIRRSRWVVILGLLLAVGSAAAQEIPGLFQFRFANPGARSLGFGGAFAALSDDATAAYANPAGLVQLVDPEFFFELRITGFSGEGFDDLNFSALGFLSFVYPHKNWSVAIYQANLGRSETNFGLPLSLIGPNVGRRATSTLAVENLGVAAAYRWSENFSLGVGLARFKGEFEATSEFFEGPTGDANQFFSVTTVDEMDTSLNAGFLWKLSEHWDFGGFIRQGPGFLLDSRRLAVTPESPDGVLVDSDPLVPFDLADVFGLGVTYQSKNGGFTASFEWDRVSSAGGLDSGDELHLGAEFVVLKTSPVLALRLGVWRDPDRQSDTDPRFLPLLPAGDDVIHLAGGIGIAFKNLKLDFGFDHADRINTGSFSLVYAF